jgi:hypothetical protein
MYQRPQPSQFKELDDISTIDEQHQDTIGFPLTNAGSNKGHTNFISYGLFCVYAKR